MESEIITFGLIMALPLFAVFASEGCFKKNENDERWTRGCNVVFILPAVLLAVCLLLSLLAEHIMLTSPIFYYTHPVSYVVVGLAGISCSTIGWWMLFLNIGLWWRTRQVRGD